MVNSELNGFVFVGKSKRDIGICMYIGILWQNAPSYSIKIFVRTNKEENQIVVHLDLLRILQPGDILFVK